MNRVTCFFYIYCSSWIGGHTWCHIPYSIINIETSERVRNILTSCYEECTNDRPFIARYSAGKCYTITMTKEKLFICDTPVRSSSYGGVDLRKLDDSSLCRGRTIISYTTGISEPFIRLIHGDDIRGIFNSERSCNSRSKRTREKWLNEGSHERDKLDRWSNEKTEESCHKFEFSCSIVDESFSSDLESKKITSRSSSLSLT